MKNIVFRPNVNRTNQEFNRVLGGLFNRPMQDLINHQKVNHFPAYANIEELGDKFIISLSVPGFDKEEINIALHENRLTVSGQKQKKENVKYHLNEFNEGNFERVFFLPDDVQKERIEATSQNGILQLTILKAEQKAPLRIEVK